jgi:hypothetical protein
MKQYLLSIYQPDGGTPSKEFLDEVGKKLHAMNQELKSAGAWVFSRGLHAASQAMVVRPAGGEVRITDGPYVESKEHVGGFWIIKSPDLETALKWARQAAETTTLPIEVRAFQDVPEH